MAELAPAGGGGPNRLFVILAVGLGALLILGLIGVGGIFLLQRAGSAGSAQPAATLGQNTLVISITTPTRVALAPTFTLSAGTPSEQPTPTFVVISGASDTPGATSTLVLGAGVGATATTAPSQLPKSGAGDNMLLLAGGVVLVLVVFAARRARFYGGA